MPKLYPANILYPKSSSSKLTVDFEMSSDDRPREAPRYGPLFAPAVASDGIDSSVSTQTKAIKVFMVFLLRGILFMTLSFENSSHPPGGHPSFPGLSIGSDTQTSLSRRVSQVSRCSGTPVSTSFSMRVHDVNSAHRLQRKKENTWLNPIILDHNHQYSLKMARGKSIPQFIYPGRRESSITIRRGPPVSAARHPVLQHKQGIWEYF